MHSTVNGLVLREVNYRDSDKMLTILTEHGKISAVSRGARTQKSVLRAGTQLLSYSEFTLFESNSRFSVDKADIKELFIGIRNDIEKLALGSYFAELLDILSDEDAPSPGLLKTGLNCIYALSQNKKPDIFIKSVFEFRCAIIAGYSPALSACAVCGAEHPEAPALGVITGQLVCLHCSPHPATLSQISPGVLTALKYLLFCDDKKILSFSLSADDLLLMSRLTEQYLLGKLERKIHTLDFYKSLYT